MPTFTPIESSVKAKVITSYLTGNGRNQITRDLHGQGIRKSRWSISKIGQYSKKNVVGGTVGTCTIGICTGGPLASFFDKNIAAIYPPSSYEPEPLNSITFGEPVFVFEGLEAQVDIKSDANYGHVNSKAPTVKEAYKIAEEATGKNQQNQDLRLKIDPEEVEEEESHTPSSNIAEWNPDQSWERRFLKTILNERRLREEQMEWINRRRYNIGEHKKQIEQSKRDFRYNLEIREQKLLEVEPFLPMTQQLRDMSLGFEEMIFGLFPWVAAIQEKAVSEKISVLMAAADIAKTINLYRQVRSLQDAIEQQKSYQVLKEWNPGGSGNNGFSQKFQT